MLIGFLGGILYEIFALVRLILGCERGKNKLLGILLDLIFFVLFAVICIFASFFLRFSGLRTYMWLGFGVGGAIYAKTLRRILAFLQKLCYNIARKIIRKTKKQEKTL